MDIRKLKDIQNFSGYKALIGSPVSLGSLSIGVESTGVTLPNNAWIGVSSSIATTTGQLVCTVNTREIGIKGGEINSIFRLGYLSKGKIVKIKPLSGLSPCIIRLYVLDHWFRPFLIASGDLA